MPKNPFKRGKPRYSYDDPHLNSNSTKRILRIAIPAIVGVIIVAILIVSGVKIVDAGNRGVLLNFGAVDVSRSLDEGIHFVVPVRDSVVQLEVRTQRITEDAASASGDLQDVRTQVALNYHLDPDNAQNVYKNLGLDYANRVIVPAIQESVKQVTARFNAEELITQRESVKNEIEQQIRSRLAAYNIIVDAISITEFQFSADFVRAVEAKVAAQQRALQAQNELRRIEIEAQQAEAQAITTIDEQLRQSPSYLEWLKSQRWDGQLPLVVGGGGTGANGQSVTPFIEIPTSRNEFESANTENTTSASSRFASSGETLQSVLNNTLVTNAT